ncbi:MAG: hypothetical protein LBN11_07605 [Tannerella sp.]|jgi:hypothetical protein|nr:hypothetical protein [Tannerella sp.]
MPTINDGYIYGSDKLYFNQKEFGYIDENGLTAGGDAPSTTKVRAAQLKNAVVKNILTTPGSKTFTFNLIQLLGENIQDVFGGTVDANGDYSAPREEATLEGKLLIQCFSGHRIAIPKASITGNLSGAINMAGVLTIACTVEILAPGEGSPFQILAPDSTADLTDYLPVAEG